MPKNSYEGRPGGDRPGSRGRVPIGTRRTSHRSAGEATARAAAPDDTGARDAVIEACRRMHALGINQGTSGNISVRRGARMLITPSATPCEEMRPEMIASMAIAADDGCWDGPLQPSTEWRFHRDILRARPDIGAVVHAHPTFCTTLAIARKEIPAVHYMMAAFGGMNIRCAPYATFGTPELSAHAVAALEDRAACLLANHGMIACGPTLARAMWLAVELETLARQFFHALLIGGPVLLTAAEVEAAKARFSSYGLREPAAPDPSRAGRGGSRLA